MTRLPFAALVAFSVVTTFACQKAEPKPGALDTVGGPTGGGSGGAMDGSADGAIGPTGCSPLSNDAAIVGERYIDTVIPTPLGGVITAAPTFSRRSTRTPASEERRASRAATSRKRSSSMPRPSPTSAR